MTTYGRVDCILRGSIAYIVERKMKNKMKIEICKNYVFVKRLMNDDLSHFDKKNINSIIELQS